MTEALRKAAQKYVDAREALDMVNKRIHPQTWANLDEDADKALNDLRAALSAPEPAGPTQGFTEWAQQFGLTPDDPGTGIAALAYAAGRASKEQS